MLTLEEIRSSTINPLAVREAYSQAEKRLIDILDTKKGYEQKAFTLLNAYITVSAALFGTAGYLLKNETPFSMPLPFILTGAVVSTGAVFLVWALLDKSYGSLGSDPKMWLNRGTIDSNDAATYTMLAYITYYHQERIDLSVSANDRMAKKIRVGVFLGTAAPIVFAAIALAQTLS